MISVRNIEEADLEMIMHWRMSEYVTRFMNTDPVLTLKDQQEWYHKQDSDIHNIYWLVEVDKAPAGIINLINIDWRQKSASWGYYIGEKTLRSLKLAISLEMSLYDYVFNILNFKLLKNEIFSINDSVIKLHLACGSQIDSIEQNGVKKNGKSYDITNMSINAERWRQIRNKKKYEYIDFAQSRKIHHLGIAVANLEISAGEFRKLGYLEESTSVHDTDRGVLIMFMKNRADSSKIELIQPVGKDNPVSKTLSIMKNMATPYHICYETKNIDRAVNEFKCMGYVIVAPLAPAMAMNGRRVVFLLRKDAGLIELLEQL